MQRQRDRLTRRAVDTEHAPGRVLVDLDVVHAHRTVVILDRVWVGVGLVGWVYGTCTVIDDGAECRGGLAAGRDHQLELLLTLVDVVALVADVYRHQYWHRARNNGRTVVELPGRPTIERVVNGRQV